MWGKSGKGRQVSGSVEEECGSVGEGREWIGVSVLPAGLVYHKPPSCQYYDRSEMDTVSFAQDLVKG